MGGVKAHASDITLFCVMPNDLDNSFTTETHTSLSLRKKGKQGGWGKGFVNKMISKH